MESLGANIRRRADELGLSAREVARRAGLSDQRFNNYLTGRRAPDLSTLVRIANVLAISTDVLLGLHGQDRERSERELLEVRLGLALSSLDQRTLDVLSVQIFALAEAIPTNDEFRPGKD